MWTRRELKYKAKERLRVNYWKCILAALLLSIIGFGAGSGSSSHLFSRMRGNNSQEEYTYNTVYEDGEERYEDPEYYENEEEYDADLDEIFSSLGEKAGRLPDGEANAGKGIAVMFFFMMIMMILFIVLVVFLVIVLPLEILIMNPLEVGIRRFFHKNLTEEANFREICYVFDHHYKNVVKIMFFRDLYVILWSLLFIVPGIVKAYEYRMIPYILEENPNIGMEEAFARSRFMMSGSKWRAFVLDLSFLGWYILSGLTIGILGIFYVNPYVAQTRAALYQKLKERGVSEEVKTIQG
ncbi:DUF975 family protein [Lachnospiraceae bacterium]|nr:DUF975 family protein [Lachnospiraceae bacterium]